MFVVGSFLRVLAKMLSYFGREGLFWFSSMASSIVETDSESSESVCNVALRLIRGELIDPAEGASDLKLLREAGMLAQSSGLTCLGEF